MSRIWIKLYLETLDDPKMGRLPDRLWRRCVEFFLMAGKMDEDGKLPTVEEMAWVLRISEEDVLQDLTALEKVGITRKAENWVVVNFKKRQYSESYERVKRYRNARSNAGGNTDEAEKWSSSSSTSDSDSNSQEGGGAGEETNYPETVREANEHPDIQVWKRVTNGGFPAMKDYRNVIDTVQLLREKHGSNLDEYLTPYWTAWSTRKSKDGKPYSRTSLVWLCEWAVQGEIPNANGHEPKSTWTPVPDVESTRKMLEEKDKIKVATGKPIAELAGRMTKKK